MKKEKEAKISYFAAHITTIVSVTMLLLIVGVTAMLGVAARRAVREVKESHKVSIIMCDTVTDDSARSLAATLKKEKYAKTVKVITKAEALADWNAATGDDLEAIAGTNPLSPEIEINITEEHASKAALGNISKKLGKMAGVEEVVLPDGDTLSAMDNFFERAFLVLGIAALALILISFVLINNTVMLTIYSRRFTIHTMQLVGATNGFIRSPFVKNNLLSGVIAAALASLILGATIFFVSRSEMPDILRYIDWPAIGIIFAGLFAAGMLMCGLAAWIATNRYLRKEYDDLFK